MNGSSYRLIVCAALTCGLLAQEPGASYMVSGVVLDARTGFPISGATVVSDGGPSSTTDERGAFEARVSGSLTATLFVSMRGYVSTMVRNLRAGAAPRVALQPNPEVTGQVVDAETGEPVKGAFVFPVPPGNRGSFIPLFTGRDKTGDDGRFAIPIGTAGTLLLEVSPATWTRATLLVPRPSEAEKAAVDHDYEMLVWPGAGGPLRLTGVNVESGVLRVRKTNFCRATVAVPAGGCEAGARDSGG
jgi:hypothetical protein